MKSQIVLLCDKNFLVPTIGTALAARSRTTDRSISVTVFIIGDVDQNLSSICSIFLERGVHLRSITIEELAQVSPKTFNKTHVPVATMSRLWIHKFVDPDCERFLYLDGDLDIAGDLQPLFEMDVPSGGFLAAPDLPLLIGSNWGRSANETRAYLKGLNLEERRSYFNAGVLLVDRRGWPNIAAEAWDFFCKFPERCKFHDQSALNATAQAHRHSLSLLWNYQTDFMAVADPRRWNVYPAIWHFTGFPKPWNAQVFPWHGFGSSYALGKDAIDRAAMSLNEVDRSSEIAEAVRQRNKLRWRLEWIYPWRRLARTKIIKEELNIKSTRNRSSANQHSANYSPTSPDSGGYLHVVD